MIRSYFYLLNQNLGGSVWYAKDRENICFTSDQTRYIYKKGRIGYHS